jgi:Uma2 family endonuclease
MATPAMQPHPLPYTADEVLAWPEDQLLGQRHELIDGSLLVSPFAAVNHQIVCSELMAVIRPALPAGWRVLGPVNLRVSDSTLLEPDLVVVDSLPRGALAFTPDAVRVAVEVVSPSTRHTDRVTKPAIYAEAGIEHYWLVDDLDRPDGPTVKVFHLAGDRYRQVLFFDSVGWIDVKQPFEVRINPVELLR